MTEAAQPPAATIDPSTRIDLRNFLWVAVALAILVSAIVSRDVWYLNFVHVAAGLMWTGIDLFMGFIIGPLVRRLEFPARRAFLSRLMPKMVFIMTTLSIVTPTAGWFLAEEMGYLDLVYPERWWLIAALVITTILGVQGVGILLPTNLMVYFEMQKPAPDAARIGRLMRRYVRVVASQGVMQVAIIVVMTRFATGL